VGSAFAAPSAGDSAVLLSGTVTVFSVAGVHAAKNAAEINSTNNKIRMN
jgi:hypothetical protein